MRNLIKYDNISFEDKFFKSIVDYEKLLNEVSTDIRNDFEELTEYYFQNIDTENLSSIIQTISNIEYEDIPIIMKLYISKDYKSLLDFSTNYIKIGCSAWLNHNHDYIDIEYPLQHIWISHFIPDGEETFKDCIFSIIF